jgi:hypothetical protein
MANFVSGVPHLVPGFTHTRNQGPFCTSSFCMSRLQEARFNFLKRELLQTYGYEQMLTLTNLVPHNTTQRHS